MRIFDNYNAVGNVKSFEDFKLSFAREDIPECYKARIKELADEAAETKVPMCPARYYREFVLNGNRTRYEKPYFVRRQMLTNLTVGEYTFDDGRYIDALIDVIWAICEETTWVLPAHNAHDKTNCIEKQLGMYFSDDVFYIDLFSAMTGAQIALAWYLFRDKLEAACPDTVVRRMEYELNRQIIHPMKNCPDIWWSSLKGNYVNNWNPWIVSNLMTVVALFERDLSKREELTALCCKMIDGYINILHSDVCCDEGTSYFWVSAGAVFNFLEVFADISLTPPDILQNELLVKFAEYIMKMHIANNNQFVTFCDCPRFGVGKFEQLYRVGKLLKSERLVAFAGKYMDENHLAMSYNLPYNTIKGAATTVEKSEFTHEKYYYFDKWQIMTARNTYGGREIFTAAKAGANNEGHGHLDDGSFVLYIDGNPVFLDVGAPPYTKDTFNENRFKAWPMRSLYHNTPSVDDIEQSNGSKFKATDVVFENSVLSMELKESLSESDGIVSLHRCINADNGFTVTDKFEFETERTYKFNLVSASKPVIDGNTFKIDTPDGIHAEFEMTKGFDVSYEEVRDTHRAVTIPTVFTERLSAKRQNRENLCLSLNKIYKYFRRWYKSPLFCP